MVGYIRQSHFPFLSAYKEFASFSTAFILMFCRNTISISEKYYRSMQTVSCVILF